MTDRQAGGWTAAAGLAFVALTVMSNVGLRLELPALGAPGDTFLAFFKSNHDRILLGAAFDASAVTLFVVFAAGLAGRLGRSGSALGVLAVFGAGLAVVISYVLDIAIIAATKLSEVGAAGAIQPIFATGMATDLFFPFSIALFMGATAAMILRDRGIPAWAGVWAAGLAVASAVLAPAGLLAAGVAAIGFAVFLLVLVWIVAVSLILIRSPAPVAEMGRASAGA